MHAHLAPGWGAPARIPHTAHGRVWVYVGRGTRRGGAHVHAMYMCVQYEEVRACMLCACACALCVRMCVCVCVCVCMCLRAVRVEGAVLRERLEWREAACACTCTYTCTCACDDEAAEQREDRARAHVRMCM